MVDVRRGISIGLPLGSILLFLVVAIASPAYYRSHVRKHETGWQEQGTVLCLVPAIALGIATLTRRRLLPARWLRAWVVLVTLGALYFAGEECSWGQNYFGWSTPESWSSINDQHETNLHNTSGLFDHAPRAALSLAAGFCMVSPFVLPRRQREWNRRTNPLPWFFPTTAVVPAATLAILVGIPQKLYGQYDKSGAPADWFSEMFLAGRHSEMKEYFLAMFILMYVWSIAVRLRDMSETGAATAPNATGTREDQGATVRGRAAA